MTGIRGFARVTPHLKRAVFAGEGRKFGLPPYEIDKAAK
jgi:hypothetical protein